MFAPDILTFQEFAMGERLPLSVVHNAILEFLQGRDDAVVFGAQAVNAYVTDPRMTQDVDLQSTRARELADDLREYLHGRFHIAVRVREIAGGRGFRVYQIQESGNRHLADVRPVPALPPARRVAGVLVVEPAELIAGKVIGHERRRGKPKSWTDRRDLAMLLLTFPELKVDAGPVRDALQRMGASPEAFEFWEQLVREDIQPESEEF